MSNAVQIQYLDSYKHGGETHIVNEDAPKTESLGLATALCNKAVGLAYDELDEHPYRLPLCTQCEKRHAALSLHYSMKL